jgi:multisubunit Na+/H+ antiporter MnhB subunit
MQKLICVLGVILIIILMIFAVQVIRTETSRAGRWAGVALLFALLNLPFLYVIYRDLRIRGRGRT